MIVEMSRLLIVGPKRLLEPVVDEVQRLGAVHVDRVETEESPRVSAMTLSEEETRAAQTLERGVTRVDGILTLLPEVSGEDVQVESSVYTALTLKDIEAYVGPIEQRVRDLTRKKLELKEEQDLIKTYEGAVRVLSPLLAALAHSKILETVGFILNTKDLTAVAGVRNELEKATEGRVEVVSRTVVDRRIGVVVAFRRADADAVRATLTRNGISEMRLPARFVQETTSDTVALMERRKEAIPGEVERIDGELVQIATKERPRLATTRAVVADRLSQVRILPELMESRYAFVIHGWAPAQAVDNIRRTLTGRFGKDIVVYDSPADPHHEPDRIPVKLDNHPLIRPFQILLGLFPPPRYGTWDPSPLMAVTFPFFVGLVIGDVGYGVLFFLLGWFMRTRAKAGRPMRVPILEVVLQPPALADLSWFIRVIGFWVILFGVIYTEVFGNLPELLFHVHPIFDRVNNQANQDLYLKIILLFGIVMIYLGLFGHLAMAIRHRHREGIFESLVTIFTLSALLVWLGTQAQMLPASLGPWSLYFLIAAVIAAVASLKAMSLMWFLESFTAFGHVLSHARLLAFGIAAAALALAANEIGPEMARGFGIPLVVAGVIGALIAGLFQIMFFIFTIIGHVIQPARLHWVEFLTKVKYHDEAGRVYQPFEKTGGGSSA